MPIFIPEQYIDSRQSCVTMVSIHSDTMFVFAGSRQIQVYETVGSRRGLSSKTAHLPLLNEKTIPDPLSILNGKTRTPFLVPGVE